MAFKRGLVLGIVFLGLIFIGSSGGALAGIFSPSANSQSPSLNISLDLFAQGLSQPLGVVHAGDDRLFAIEKAGRIRIIRPNGSVDATPFLDINSRVDSAASEMGLLGIAFHPNYANNGYFYLQYTHTANSNARLTRLSRFSVSPNPDIADAGSEQVLLTINQPHTNHNAGGIYFSPTDGYLYVPMGDGGSGGDPNNNGQKMSTLLGKVVRIDVDSGAGAAPDCVGGGSGAYTIPNSNPFRDGTGGVCDEIWGVGLRNPWRSGFDRATGDLYIGDVGQNSYEEVSHQPAGMAGLNYGWRCYEGNHPYNLNGCGSASSYVFPILETAKTNGNCSMVGGYVYRGVQYPAMIGHYLAADYCTGHIWDLTPDGNGGWNSEQHSDLADFSPVSFGEDVNGELYLVKLGGTIFKIKENTTAAMAGIVLGNDNQIKPALPNSTVTFTHVVTNAGNIQDTFRFSATSGQGWAVDVDPPLTLNPGVSASTHMTVVTGLSAPPGTTDSVILQATSDFDSAVTANVTDMIEILNVTNEIWLPAIHKSN